MTATPFAVPETLAWTVTLAREAGALLRDRFAESHREMYKGTVELVTEMDTASEQMIVAEIREHFPEHAIEAEEGFGKEEPSGYRWFVDPLDGTHNYAHGYPHFCVSLALYQGGQPLLGVVYDPLLDECFWAAHGGGAFLNGRPLHVSSRAPLINSLVSTGFPYDKATNPDNNVAEFTQIATRVSGIRRSGSAALDLCYVAAGRQEAHWELGLKPWDIAAGGLIVLEAAWMITGPGRQPWNVRTTRLVASNGLIHDELLQMLGWL
jgi:myo-inositol-1(or 4)-monophosphatase